MRRSRTGQLYGEGCREAGRVPDGNDCVWSSMCMWPARTRKHVSGVYSEQKRVPVWRLAISMRCSSVRPSGWFEDAPRAADSDVTVESVIEARVIYGATHTVAEKLLAFRPTSVRSPCSGDRMDWGGPNREWESESMRRLAEEVMPLLRRQTTARAAE